VIRVLLADDQALVRSGFRMILEARPDFEVVGEAENGLKAVRLARELEPDVVLMDVRMPGLDGVEATRRLVAAATSARILILTTFDLDQPEELADAIRVVAAGNALFGPTATERLLKRFTAQPEDPKLAKALDTLTGREREILELLAAGLSNHELSTHLFLSETTVKTHVSSIFRKLGVRDRVQAVIAAYDAGLVRPGAP